MFLSLSIHQKGKKAQEEREAAENIPEFALLLQMDLRHPVSVRLMKMLQQSGQKKKKRC